MDNRTQHIPRLRVNLSRDLTALQMYAICCRAKDVCYNWWVDILDCSVSTRRQRIEMPFEDIMGKLSDTCLFSIIRREYPWEDYWEVGFCTMKSPDYFLWIQVEPEAFKPILSLLTKEKP